MAKASADGIDISSPIHTSAGRVLPARAGVSLKQSHYTDILDGHPDLGFFEIHAENYMGAGGPPHHFLERIRADYALSLHGVGLSIGADGPLDRTHLDRLRELVRRYDPQSFSEHLAWSTHADIYFADLLPLPYDEATLSIVCAHVAELQDHVQRKVLIENPSTYVEFAGSTMEEIHFLDELVSRTGCGLLLDVNNVHVSSTNRNRSADAYIDQFPMEHVGEIHLAGFAIDADAAGAPLLIDAHGCSVYPQVWSLYERTLRRCGPVATLVEWDNDVPAFDILSAEAERAEMMLCAERERRNQKVA